MPAHGQEKQDKHTQGKKAVPSSSAKPKPKKATGRDTPQDAKEKDERIKFLERENMMLRKELNIEDIIEEFKKKGCQESDMKEMFRESLHFLELKLQQCRCGETSTESKADTEKKLSKAQDDLRIGKQNLESTKSDLEAKNKLILELKMQLKQQSSGKKTDGPETDSTKIKQLEQELNDLKGKLNASEKNLTKKNDDSQKKDDGSKQIREEYETKLKKQETECQKKLQEMEDKENDLQSKLKEMEEKVNKHNGEIKKLKEEHDKALKDNGKHKVNENDFQTKDDEIKRLKDAHEKALKDKEKHAEDLQNKIQQITDSHKKETDALQGKHAEDLHNKIQQITDEYKKQTDALQDRIQKLQKEKSNVNRTSGSSESKELADARDEISDLKNRLSKVVGAKVMDDNPNITDLSDENRPTKLAEQYSELYDNQWTDAFEEAEKNNVDEKKNIKELYDQLVKIYLFCQEQAAKHATSIQNAVLGLTSGSNTKDIIEKLGVTKVRLLKELRKSIAPHLVDQVFQLFVKEKKFNGNSKMEIFARECCKLCWLMASQDPPVVLDTTEAKGAFDGDKFRAYTKTGKTIDYVVWPALLLHKGGPLLGKGVAQGK